MFSPEASIISQRSSLRATSKRRQRTSEGLQQQPLRKRSKLSEETFIAKDDAHINGNGAVLVNGNARRDSPESSLVLVDMPVREKRAPPKRAVKEGIDLYLTKNANYSVKKLPGIPKLLLSTPYRASALPSAGLALALTHGRVLVWDYNAASPSKIVSLSVPFALKASDPLPLGAIVRNGPTNDFGVVAIAPSTGKIAFWENIDSAEARSLYPQRHQGAEGSVKLYSGEVVNDVVDVEHAGFVLVTSSGRLVHLTLRDSQGRPSITTAVLTMPISSHGSFFSLRGLLGATTRKTIASTKACPSKSKGHMEVITVTSTGVFQQWDLNWSGQHNFVREINAHANLASAVQPGSSPEARDLREVQVLDFAIMEQQRSHKTAGLLVLVASCGSESIDYSLLEVRLASIGTTITRVIPLRHFHQPQVPQEPSATLLLPHPGHTAYIKFPGAICVASLAQPEDTPDNQILFDSGRPPLPFQDTIYFREDRNVVFAGQFVGDQNPKEKRALAFLFVQGYGVIEISAQPPTMDDGDENRLRVTARSKLEQAIFFGINRASLLDFSVKSRFSFPDDEIAQAALDIGSGILSSSYEYIDKVTLSMNDHFQKRAFALRTLINQLLSDYPPLSFITKWRLLWQAEKLAAAHKLWLWYQEKQQDQQKRPEAYPDKILMGDIIRALHERYKTPIRPELGETDHIRQFFLKDVDTVNLLIPWGWFYLRAFYIKDGLRDDPPVMQRLSEGEDVMLVALETAFEFRQANIEFYDLDPNSLDDGILKPGHGYDLLPYFWTSSHNLVNSIRSLVDVGRNLAVSNFEEGYQEALAQKIGKDNPRLVKIGCQTHIERFQWALEQSGEKQREMGRSLKNEWNKTVRPSHIIGLMEIGLATDGMKLAEQYHDMPTLVDLVWGETKWLESEKAKTRSKMEQVESTVKLNRIKERIPRYFDTYGDDWAEAFYSKYIGNNQAAQLFSREYLNQPALTKFLRADSSRARLRWINEVCGEKNYEAAAAALHDVATKQETNAWCQRVELSIAKLSMLCKKQGTNDLAPQPSSTGPKSKAERVRHNRFASIARHLGYAKMREDIYEQMLPTISNALDDESAVTILMNEFGQGSLTQRPALQAVLKEGFENLVHHRVIDPAFMIDILTLLDPGENESVLRSSECVYAMRILMTNGHEIHKASREGLMKLIWKRLCIKDDWAKINKTKEVSDAQLEDFLLDTKLARACAEIMHLNNTNPSLRMVWPKRIQDMVGAGGTHGELCVRFASEDIRDPIIKDNMLDDVVLTQHIEQNRLDQWYAAACEAGKKAYRTAMLELGQARQQQQQQQQQPVLIQVIQLGDQGQNGGEVAAVVEQ